MIWKMSCYLQGQYGGEMLCSLYMGRHMLFQGRYYEETSCYSLDILQIVEYVLEVMPVLFRVTSAIVGEGGIVKC